VTEAANEKAEKDDGMRKNGQRRFYLTGKSPKKEVHTYILQIYSYITCTYIHVWMLNMKQPECYILKYEHAKHVCRYTYTRTWACAYIHIYTHTLARTRDIHQYTRTHVHIHTYTWAYTRNIYKYARTHVHTYTCTRTCGHVHKTSSKNTCTHVHIHHLHRCVGMSAACTLDICQYTRTHIHTCTYTHIHTDVHKYTEHLPIHTYTHIHIYTHIGMYTRHLPIHTYTYTHIHTCMSMYNRDLPIHTYTYTHFRVYTCKFTYTHIHTLVDLYTRNLLLHNLRPTSTQSQS